LIGSHSPPSGRLLRSFSVHELEDRRSAKRYLQWTIGSSSLPFPERSSRFFFAAIPREVELHLGHCGAGGGLSRSASRRALVHDTYERRPAACPETMASHSPSAQHGSRAAPQLPDGWGPGWMELTSVADDSLLRKLHGDFPQLCVEGEVGGGGASREVWVTEETDPYFGRGLNESQNASSL
jgi:hypothetical protein